ncbi:uncharacterized protein LOC111698478 isoform X2 [Eurytemora carolleeae]|uniref:uncharacterized protein LOC111698478 isoform X2 n=1 Tax=Eurytemora carolleeae TaxID=1294199 RepID=UPI000C785C7C|nr:uncharacterized protein LOC111698478 isoform X2 [Eurytemora carolleeae]|eukprot:XP_023324595.1 uncharacterized protein LOC111698478 isoform X2 [Eurytemora affinis]
MFQVVISKSRVTEIKYSSQSAPDSQVSVPPRIPRSVDVYKIQKIYNTTRMKVNLLLTLFSLIGVSQSSYYHQCKQARENCCDSTFQVPEISLRRCFEKNFCGSALANLCSPAEIQLNEVRSQPTSNIPFNAGLSQSQYKTVYDTYLDRKSKMYKPHEKKTQGARKRIETTTPLRAENPR